MTAPPVPYFGSKASVAHWIAERIPSHRHYVEPFAGGLSVLLAKTPSAMETVNDIDGVTRVHLRGVHPAPDQNVALRLVAFADRLYDRAIPVVVSGDPLPSLFTEEMVDGGYRKKYLRAVSRLTALARDAAQAT